VELGRGLAGGGVGGGALRSLWVWTIRTRDKAEAGAQGRGVGGEERLYRRQFTPIRFLLPGQGSEAGGEGTPTPGSFLIASTAPWLPSPSPAGTAGPGRGGEGGPHLESIRRAGRARAPGPAAEGGGEPRRNPHHLVGSAGAEEGPGRGPSPAPPAAGFHQQMWPGQPRAGNPA
jgi:hypothetical protein